MHPGIHLHAKVDGKEMEGCFASETFNEVLQELKRKNGIIEELEIKCYLLEGKDARSKKSMEELAKDLNNEILLLKMQLLSREETAGQLQVDAADKKREDSRTPVAQLREEFQKEKLRIHERYQRTLLEIYSKMRGSSPYAAQTESPLQNPSDAAQQGFPHSKSLSWHKPTSPPVGAADTQEKRALAECTLAMFLDIDTSVLEVRDAVSMTPSCVTTSEWTSTDDLFENDTLSRSRQGKSWFRSRPLPARVIRKWQQRKSTRTPWADSDSEKTNSSSPRSESKTKKAETTSQLVARLSRSTERPLKKPPSEAAETSPDGEAPGTVEEEVGWDEWIFVREASARASTTQPLRPALRKGRSAKGAAASKSVAFAKRIEQITPTSAMVHAAQAVVASLKKENLQVCFQLTTTLKELQATEEAMATLKQELSTAVVVRDKLAVEVRQKDTELERLLQDRLDRNGEGGKGSPETTRRLQEALKSLREMQRSLKEEEQARADADVKWQRRYDALREMLEKRVRVEKQMRRQYAELRKAVKHFMDRKTPKAEVCSHCLAAGRHVALMEDEMKEQSASFEDTVRRMWGELSQVKAIAKPDGAGLARIYKEVLNGLQLFAQFDADTQVLREQLAAVTTLNESLEEKVAVLQLELGKCREAAAHTKLGPHLESRRTGPTVVTLDGGCVPAKAIQLFTAISAHAAASNGTQRWKKVPDCAGQPEAPAEVDASVKLDAARYILDLLVRSCEPIVATPDGWQDRKSGWDAAERYVAGLQLPERVVARAQLLLDKLLFRQSMVLLAAASDFPRHPGLRAIVQPERLATLLSQAEPRPAAADALKVPCVKREDDQSSAFSGSDAEAEANLAAQLVDAGGDAQEDMEEVDLMLECVAADADNQKQLIATTGAESFAKVNRQELLLIKEAMQPTLASSLLPSKRVAAATARTCIQFRPNSGGARRHPPTSRILSKLAQKQSQALTFASQGEEP
eukprot:GGOE01003968.1.p1 GENE.GGOE01003968.1~~GGOE01003968.1.p1  ORF type:complete len:976 (+),score=230.54 GGOE01003968.1:36-2963(+)